MIRRARGREGCFHSLTTAVSRFFRSLVEVNRVADFHLARRAYRSEHADVRAMVVRGSPQNRVVAFEVFLRMSRHHTAQRRLERDYLERAPDRERTADPIVLKKRIV